jgi:hypothetical protein
MDVWQEGIFRSSCQGREAKERKARLSAGFQDLRYIESERLEEISPIDVAEAIRILRSTLEFATPIERKALRKEHVTEIRVRRKGPALLEANPAGLLRCIEMVTPRGVHVYATLVAVRNPSLLLIKLRDAA